MAVWTSGNDVITVVVDARQYLLDGDDILDVQAAFGLEVYAGAGNDLVRASEFADVIYSGAGQDTIEANGGADYIEAGEGTTPSPEEQRAMTSAKDREAIRSTGTRCRPSGGRPWRRCLSGRRCCGHDRRVW
jgi:hypothetical protein